MLQGREVIFEMVPYGNLIKVSAMDTKTMTEIVIQAPKGTSKELLQQNALRRLDYVLKKKGLI